MINFQDGLIQGCKTVRFGDPDRRRFHALRPCRLQFLGKPAGLLAGAGHQNPLAEQWAFVEPTQTLPQVHDLADHKDRRWGHPLRRHIGNRVADRRNQGFLLRCRTPANHCGRRVGGPPVGNQLCRDMGQVFDPHQKHQRIDRRGQFVPLHAGLGFFWIFMAGHHGKRSGDCPVRHRNPGVGRHGDRRSDAGNDFKLHAMLTQKQRFFAAATEHKRIAALKPQYRFVLFGQAHQ